MKKWIRFFLICSLLLFLCYVGIYAYARFTPKLPIDSANSYYLYDKENNLVSNRNSKEWISLNEISPYLINATISIEDKNFYKHQGFDFLRIAKAMYVNLKSGKTLQGASTITQQYAKNLFLDFGKTWNRKIDEAWLTIRLESHYSKDQILEGYLNTINYGGIFGIENASKYYFNKSAKDLTLAEATILAGIPKWPSVYSPLANEEASKKRQKLILDSMVKNKYITEQEAEEASKVDLTYNGTKSQHNLSTLTYYQDAVIEELKSIRTIPSSFLETGGLRIYTNLDLNAQTIMENNIKKYMTDTELQISSVMIDPENGKVIALAGGTDYSKSQFNRAISSKRQVGSTMKPFLYYSALENGFTPSTTFTSEKTTFTFAENKTYSPKNYADNYPNKPISMAAALSYSDNIYAVKTHLFLGEDTLVETAKRVGISSSLGAIPSLALGSEEIGILEMMEGYMTFANEGYKIEPYFIRKVEDANGNVLYEKKEEKEQVLNKSIVYVLNEMLTNTYAKEFIDYNYPTCISIAPKISKKYAIKTGTTDTDHWIFGYNKKILMGIWNGYDDNRNSDVNDGTINKNIWIDTVEEYLENEQDYWYEMPKNVVGAFIDPINGTLATEETSKKKMLYYIKGTEPSYEEGTLDASIPTIKVEE
ncbi:MAG: penicillin-binding protein [Bacilli bacterium]|nr:penicillin-binding protein [Bacilli bacterium]